MKASRVFLVLALVVAILSLDIVVSSHAYASVKTHKPRSVVQGTTHHAPSASNIPGANAQYAYVGTDAYHHINIVVQTISGADYNTTFTDTTGLRPAIVGFLGRTYYSGPLCQVKEEGHLKIQKLLFS